MTTQNWSTEQTDELMALLAAHPAEQYATRADRLRDIQKQVPHRSLAQIASKVQRLAQKMKRDKKSLPGSQRPGKSSKLKRKSDSTTFDSRIQECRGEMVALEQERTCLEAALARYDNMEAMLDAPFTCSLCQLNIEAQVRAVCTICFEAEYCEACYLHCQYDRDEGHYHDGRMTLVRYVNRRTHEQVDDDSNDIDVDLL